MTYQSESVLGKLYDDVKSKSEELKHHEREEYVFVNGNLVVKEIQYCEKNELF